MVPITIWKVVSIDPKVISPVTDPTTTKNNSSLKEKSILIFCPLPSALFESLLLS
jgi:hypothetical protein